MLVLFQGDTGSALGGECARHQRVKVHSNSREIGRGTRQESLISGAHEQTAGHALDGPGTWFKGQASGAARIFRCVPLDACGDLSQARRAARRQFSSSAPGGSPPQAGRLHRFPARTRMASAASLSAMSIVPRRMALERLDLGTLRSQSGCDGGIMDAYATTGGRYQRACQILNPSHLCWLAVWASA
jgi:hypothetical protein